MEEGTKEVKDSDLPIPDHLKECFTAEGLNNSEYEVTGKIKCACGNEKLGFNHRARMISGKNV